MDNTHNQTDLIIASRANLLEIVIVAVGVALGVHFVAVSVLDTSHWSALEGALLGIGLILAGCIYLIAREFPRINRAFSFEGVLPVVRKTHQVIAIDRYEFAEDTARHVKALAAENKALAVAWEDNPLSDFEFDGEHGSRQRSPASKLAREALEYFVLNELSLHLSDHFNNNPRIDESEVISFGRRDIPSVLLENHFLELFSRPMEEREAFSTPRGVSTEHRVSIKHGGKVVFQMGSGGAIYDEFELILPHRTKVSRVDADTILIQTERFSLRIEVEFDGFGATFSPDFVELYLGQRYPEIQGLKIGLNIGVRFKWWSLLTTSGWEYYRWVDSFLERVANGFSFDRFLHRIGWETALSTALIARQLSEKQSKPASNLQHNRQLTKPPEAIGSGERTTKEDEPAPEVHVRRLDVDPSQR